ncbi:MAG TPA: peptidoglycan recognition family protein [Pyrinomonadaceae bacterium]|nr:peptidoglycan recognition family protein [Pyrinomonadaceae bacterium]
MYSKIIERYAHYFDRPEMRLRFLNSALSQAATNEKLDEALSRYDLLRHYKIFQRLLKFTLELRFYRVIFQELRDLLPHSTKSQWHLLLRNRAPLSARLLFRCYQFRYALGGAGVAVAGLLLVSLFSGIAGSVRSVEARISGQNQSSQTRSGQPAPQSSVKFLPDYKPERVWLVEQRDNYERYSNGGRILMDYATENHPRGYYGWPHNKSAVDPTVRREPIGIVYHTSESDLLPFTSDNNDSIETHTRGLLEYVRRNRSYNYVIDRFGQIYRIVRDDHAANHAGNSVWEDQNGIYVGLNESFLGVCFETNSEAGSLDEQLTEAQLVSGRLLTQILRSRYQIDDTDCVTHGLVSVNPSNMLICYHHDWVRNFPFEAFGLSNKYKVAPASVSEFGFNYDEETLSKIGGSVWEGVGVGSNEFKKRAEQAGMTTDDLRRQMRERYRLQMDMVRKLHAAGTDSSADSNSES